MDKHIMRVWCWCLNHNHALDSLCLFNWKRLQLFRSHLVSYTVGNAYCLHNHFHFAFGIMKPNVPGEQHSHGGARKNQYLDYVMEEFTPVRNSLTCQRLRVHVLHWIRSSLIFRFNKKQEFWHTSGNQEEVVLAESKIYHGCSITVSNCHWFCINSYSHK